MRSKFTKAILIFALSLLLFFSFDINFRIYAKILILMAFLPLVNFKTNGQEIFTKTLVFAGSNLAAYSLAFIIVTKIGNASRPIPLNQKGVASGSATPIWSMNIADMAIILGVLELAQGQAPFYSTLFPSLDDAISACF